MDASADRKSNEINVTMEEPIRILMLFTIMNRGGAETMVMNYYRHIDRNRVQFDFMVHRQERGAYDDEIEAMGGKIYRMIPLHPFTFNTYRKQISGVSDYPWALYGIGIFRLPGSSRAKSTRNYCARTQRTRFIRY